MRKFSLAVLVVLLSGCAANYNVVTNAYTDRSIAGGFPAGSTFAVAKNPGVPNPIFDSEVRHKIETLLQNSGYRVAPEERADFVVHFSYDISGRTETVSRREVISGPPVVQRFYVTGSNGAGNYYTAVAPTPNYVTYVPESYTVYTSRLYVRVLDSKKAPDNPDAVVWVGDTITESQTFDLRNLIDYLLVATFKQFGRNTGKNVEVKLKPDAPEVQALRSSFEASAAPAAAPAKS